MREVSAPGRVAQLPSAPINNDHGESGHDRIVPHTRSRYHLPVARSHIPRHSSAVHAHARTEKREPTRPGANRAPRSRPNRMRHPTDAARVGPCPRLFPTGQPTTGKMINETVVLARVQNARNVSPTRSRGPPSRASLPATPDEKGSQDQLVDSWTSCGQPTPARRI